MNPISAHLRDLCGKAECFEESTLDSLLDKGMASSQPQLERAIHVLEYLAQLRSSGLDPLHKGGSAVQLLLPTGLQRLSVDLDIALPDREPLEEAMEDISGKFSDDFYTAELHSEAVPGSKFLDYRVKIPTLGAGIAEMKLDILLHEPSYETQNTALKTFFYDSDVEVRTPTVESMLGDKLTTLGPSSIGRPLDHSGRGLEYIKHVFDIRNLMEHSKDFKAMRTAHEDCFRFQRDLRSLGTSFTIFDALNDLKYVCRVLTLDEEALTAAKDLVPESSYDMIGRHHDACLGARRSGVRRIRPFLGAGLTLTSLGVREVAGKIAFLASLLELTSQGKMRDDLAGRAISALDDAAREISEDDVKRLTKRLRSIPKADRWHLNIPTLEKVLPNALVSWYASYSPSEFIDHYVQ